MTNSSGDVFLLTNPAEALMREVFARFGRAVYAANCLEKAVTEALLHLEWRARIGPPMTKQQYEQSYDVFISKLQPLTMGKLIRKLKLLPEAPEEIKSALQQCLAARNVLAHHYFWDRAGHFALPEGQRQMLGDCDAYAALFDRTEQQIDAFLEPYRLKIGLTDEVRNFMRDSVIASARSSMELSLTKTSPL